MTEGHGTREAANRPEHVTFRPLAERPDYAGLAAAVSASLAADGIRNSVSAEELDVFYQNLPDFDPASDSLLAWLGNQVGGEAYLIQMLEDSGRRIYFHHTYLDPVCRLPGVLPTMMDYVETRAGWLHGQRPAEDDAILRTVVSEGERDYLHEMEQRGYQPERYFYQMVRPTLQDIPEPPRPHGIELRPVQEDHFHAIWEAKEEAFEDHWGHRQTTEEDYQRFLQDPIQDPARWIVAWDGDQIAGMVLNFIDEDENRQWGRQRGYTEDISVRRPWRRRGLATYMIAESLRRLRDLGMQEAALGVDVDNPSGALTLYERLGYQVDRRSTSYARPASSRATAPTPPASI
ncbi:MAG: GNAT family N-acetyltransferase [Anaerolineales bacterium]